MKKITKIFVFTIALIFLFSNMAFAASYGGKRFIADSTKEKSEVKKEKNPGQKPKSKGQQSKAKVDVPSYKIIPRSVLNKRNQYVNDALKELDSRRKKGIKTSYSIERVIGTYSFPTTSTTLVPVKEPIDASGEMKTVRLEKREVTTYKEGNYKLVVNGNPGNVITTTRNLRVKDYTWTLKNETTGKTWPTFVTKENYTYITFYETGVYYIRAQETLVYDVYEASQVSVKVVASHNSETLQSYNQTGTAQYTRSEEKSGKKTEWRIVITEEDLGKKIPIGDTKNNTGPKPISKSSSEPSNKINVEVDYELVE